MPNHFLRPLGLLFIVMRFAAMAEAAQPWASSAFNLESGVLWQVGHNTPLPSCDRHAGCLKHFRAEARPWNRHYSGKQTDQECGRAPRV